MRLQRAGQATFLPLDSIQVKPINDKYRSFVKGARLAVDILEFDGSVERAIHYACGNALICDTMEVAKHVVYERGQEVKGSFPDICHFSLSLSMLAVTLEGTIIHKSGLITGGRSSHGSTKRRDEKELEGATRGRRFIPLLIGHRRSETAKRSLIEPVEGAESDETQGDGR